MLNKIFNTKFHLRFAFNPYIRYKSDMLGNYSGVMTLKRDTPIIVSMTSYEERFDDLELSLYSIMNQTVKPDRIILYLSNKYKDLSYIPYCVTKYIKNGLEIKFVKDIGSYTKIIYALKDYPDSVIVTADDDIIYPKDWLEKLYHSYISHPEDIQVHRAHRVLIKDSDILPYEKWEKHVDEETARYDNFLTGVGGVLYPPECFIKEVFRDDIYLKKVLFADDIWLWFMALVSGRKIRVVKNHIKTLTCTDFAGQIGIKYKKKLYTINQKGQNDEQIKNLMRFYKRNIMDKLK